VILIVLIITYLSCDWVFAILLKIWNNVSGDQRKVYTGKLDNKGKG